MFFPDYWSYGVMLSNQNPWGIPSGAIFITLDMDVCDAVDAGNARFPTPEEKAIAKSLSVDKTAGRHWIDCKYQAHLLEPEERRMMRRNMRPAADLIVSRDFDSANALPF